MDRKDKILLGVIGTCFAGCIGLVVASYMCLASLHDRCRALGGVFVPHLSACYSTKTGLPLDPGD